MFDFIESNALVLVLALAAMVILLIVILIAVNVKRSNKWREKEFENNRNTEMLNVRISELEKEATDLHEREKQLLAERDDILMAAHEKADDILEQTMERVQKSEARIRQNRIIASCCITDARRKISDLMIEVSKRLVIEDGAVLDAEEITPEAVEAAEAEEKVAANDFERAIETFEGKADASEAQKEAAAPLEGAEYAPKDESAGDAAPEAPSESEV
ncbi:MAG: hypothetical protein IJ048_03625 [Clostridia bacterium]|nr:hypothetical protein [Clostridia bacterium]